MIVAQEKRMFASETPVDAQIKTQSSRTRWARASVLAIIAATAFTSAAFAQSTSSPTALRAERNVNGTLASGDAVLEADSSLYDLYRLPVTAGQRVRVRMTSQAFPPYLQVGQVLDDECATCEVAVADDAGKAELVYTVTATGNLDIRANSASGGQTGAYTVRAEIIPEPTLAIQRIRSGQTVDSQLSETDITNEEGQSQRRFDVPLRAGTPVRISVGGMGKIDPLITLNDPSGTEVGEDDDSGPGLDSRLDFTPTRSGVHRILVTGLEPGMLGPITVQVGPVPPPQPIVRTDLVATIATQASLDETTPLEDVEGDLVRVGRFQFPITDGTIYVVETTSSAFDSFIEVDQHNGSEVVDTASDDDSGGDLNARLRFRAETSGMAHVEVRSLGGEGPYTIAYREYVPTPPPARGTPITVGASVAGKLSEASPMRMLDEDGLSEAPYAPYEVELAAGQMVTVRVNRTAEDSQLDPYLLIGTGTPGAFVKLDEDDDSGSGLNARIHFTAPSAGTYLILASSFGGVAEAEYRIEVLPYTPSTMASQALTIGTPASGQLTNANRVTQADDDGVVGQVFRFSATEGTIYVIEAKSEAFDTVVNVHSDAGLGTLVGSNDDGPDGTDSRFAFKADRTGDYYVLLSSFEGEGSGGAFTLAVTTGTEADLEANEVGLDMVEPAMPIVDVPRPQIVAPVPPPATPPPPSRPR
jgi:hypothetical protein